MRSTCWRSVSVARERAYSGFIGTVTTYFIRKRLCRGACRTRQFGLHCELGVVLIHFGKGVAMKSSEQSFQMIPLSRCRDQKAFEEKDHTRRRKRRRSIWHAWQKTRKNSKVRWSS